MKVNEIQETIKVFVNRMMVGMINIIYRNDFVYIKGYDYNDKEIIYIKQKIEDYDTEILDDIKLFIINKYLQIGE